MKLKKIVYLLLALIAAGAAAGGIYIYLLDLEEQNRLATEYKEVVVAAQFIPANETVTAEMLTLKEIPRGYVHSEGLTTTDSLVGGISKIDIYEEEQILTGKIVSPGDTGEDFIYIIDPGKRAVAISLSEVIGVGGLIVPGNYVDVIATLDNRTDDDYFEYSKIIVQNIRVLAVGKTYDPLKFKEVIEQAGTITLEVTPEQAPTLVLASEKGSVRLLLRAPGDDEEVTAPAWRIRDYLR